MARQPARGGGSGDRRHLTRQGGRGEGCWGETEGAASLRGGSRSTDLTAGSPSRGVPLLKGGPRVPSAAHPNEGTERGRDGDSSPGNFTGCFKGCRDRTGHAKADDITMCTLRPFGERSCSRVTNEETEAQRGWETC